MYVEIAGVLEINKRSLHMSPIKASEMLLDYLNKLTLYKLVSVIVLFLTILVKTTKISGGSRISRRGGRRPRGGVPTPEVATFQKICMSKWKNLDSGGGARRRGPLDPPMKMYTHFIPSTVLP